MKPSFLQSILIVLLVTGCNNRESSGGIDYLQLEEIAVEQILEIGESENFLPGNLNELIVMDDGTLLVSDQGSVTIEQFSAGGEFVGTVAREGGGPGELPQFFSLLKTREDSLVVSHSGMTLKMDLFKKNPEDGLYMHVRTQNLDNIVESGRSANLIAPIGDEGYLATTPGVITMEMLQGEGMADYNLVPVAFMNIHRQTLQDSLHILKSPTPVIDLQGNGIRVYGSPPYQNNDRLRSMEDGNYVIARPDSSAFFIYDTNHEWVEKISLEILPRKIQDRDIEGKIDHESGDIRRRFEERIPEFKPPFLDVWAAGEYFLLHTDTDPENKEMVLLSRQGEPIGKFYLSEYDEVQDFKDNRAYALHKNPDEGDSIRIYELDL